MEVAYNLRLLFPEPKEQTEITIECENLKFYLSDNFCTGGSREIIQ